MKIVKDTPFEFGFLVAYARPPQPSLTVVVKATFALTHDGVCTVPPAQAPCASDAHHDDDPARSLVYESDLGIRKPHGECTVVGTCHTPGAIPQRVSGVAFKIGAVTKALAVFGDRTWIRRALVSAPSEAEPFVSMPLTWERALGGPGHDRNPVGTGISPTVTPHGSRTVLPNIELPSALIRTPSDRPDPAGCGPIARSWTVRASRTGSVDAAWARTRWPGLPADFDWGYFNAAPRDQQIDGFWRGDEDIVLRNLHPQRALLQTRLPGRRARCFVVTAGAMREVPLVLDTLAVDTDQGVVFALWRGLTEVATEKLTDIDRMFLMDEDLSAQSSHATCAARMAEAEARESADNQGFAPETSPTQALVTPPVAPVPPATLSAMLARGDNLSGQDLTGVHLVGAELSGRDLTGTVLAGAALRGAVLTGAVLAGAVLTRAVLVDANLKGTNLARADLTGADLTGADLTGADLTGATLEGARMARAILRGAKLGRAEATRADFSEADLREATLDLADLTAAILNRANFTGASLVDTTLEGVSAVRVVMDGCDLSRLRASAGANFAYGSFRRVRAKGSRWGGAVLDRTTMSQGDFSLADFTGTSLVGATLNGCRLRGARLGEAVFTGASLLRVDAMEADFESADLSRADLRGANLFGANLWRSRTEGTKLEHANLTRTRLA